MINALGRSDISLKINIITKALFIIGIFVGIYFGIFGLIIAGLITSFISYLITGAICGKKIGFTLREQILAILPLLSVSLITFLAGFLVLKLQINDLILLVLQALIVFFVYYGLARSLRLKSYIEFRKLFKDKLPEKFRFIL